mgnify:CR=1 FL=1
MLLKHSEILRNSLGSFFLGIATADCLKENITEWLIERGENELSPNLGAEVAAFYAPDFIVLVGVRYFNSKTSLVY